VNKNLKILILLLAVLLIAYFVINRNGWNTLKFDEKEFSVKDTARVTKIFMVTKGGDKVLLERSSNNSWIVNRKLPADDMKVRLLLNTIHDMKVLKPIAPNAHNKVIGILATEGIKTEIYAGDKLVKTIYVGSETPDQNGTFMMLEDANEPYVVHIPGFVGYLTPRFFTNELKWRSRLVFNFKADEISKVSVQYFNQAYESFAVINTGQNPLLEGVVLTDLKFLKYYLSSFENIYLDGFNEGYIAQKSDSIKSKQAYCIIKLESKSGTNKKLTIYQKPVDKHTKEIYDEDSNAIETDKEKYFVFVDDDSVLATIQDYTFRNILRTKGDFIRFQEPLKR